MMIITPPNQRAAELKENSNVLGDVERILSSVLAGNFSLLFCREFTDRLLGVISSRPVSNSNTPSKKKWHLSFWKPKSGSWIESVIESLHIFISIGKSITSKKKNTPF